MAEKKEKREVITSPRGRAVYPRLNVPDTKFKADGEYSVTLAIPTKTAEDLIEKIDKAYAKSIADAKVEAKAKGKKVIEGDLPYKENPDNDDETLIRFRSSAKITVKGEEIDIKPSLFDGKGKPFSRDLKIGGGSVLRVAFELVPYYIPGTKTAGVTLRMKAVQVIEFKEYTGGGSADDFGFDEEADGFEVDADAEFGGEEDEKEEKPAKEKKASKTKGKKTSKKAEPADDEQEEDSDEEDSDGSNF